VIDDRQLRRSLVDLRAVLVSTMIRPGPVLVLRAVRRTVLVPVFTLCTAAAAALS
jgi:hypothetical protein